jgi:hypothetical protein
MATNEGGATPMKVPIQNGASRTSMTGETMLMNQLGRKGVILQEENKKKPREYWRSLLVKMSLIL